MDQMQRRGRKELPITTTFRTTILGQTVRAWRRYYGWKLTDLTIKAGYTETNRGYISKIEHGLIRHVGDEHLEKIANALHLTPSELLNGKMPPDDGIDLANLGDRAGDAGITVQISNPSLCEVTPAEHIMQRMNTQISLFMHRKEAQIHAFVQGTEMDMQLFIKQLVTSNLSQLKQGRTATSAEQKSDIIDILVEEAQAQQDELAEQFEPIH